MAIKLKVGDCSDILKNVEPGSVDMIYLDPPFFTEKRHKLRNRDRSQEFVFDDLWGCHKKYAESGNVRRKHILVASSKNDPAYLYRKRPLFW